MRARAVSVFARVRNSILSKRYASTYGCKVKNHNFVTALERNVLMPITHLYVGHMSQSCIHSVTHFRHILFILEATHKKNIIFIENHSEHHTFRDEPRDSYVTTKFPSIGHWIVFLHVD